MRLPSSLTVGMRTSSHVMPKSTDRWSARSPATTPPARRSSKFSSSWSRHRLVWPQSGIQLSQDLLPTGRRSRPPRRGWAWRFTPWNIRATRSWIARWQRFSRTDRTIFFWGDPLAAARRQALCEFALQNRLPTLGPGRYFTEVGCLVSYAPSRLEQFRRAPLYVDKILKGARPADLPLEQPTKFELIINGKTAKALGLAIPPSLLLRADQVIE
jgi:ABC transporter substrate binding protein